ncbi:vigilin-like protein [Dinothrombium tinctorium]|uniref:Vigilin-like protein n=1 Tax=Dinothrombium tinctorium TaxID=1965070 RepID=A0A3S3Q7X2_9ACAR|nr:vigilin-like protein [Dinothrombium tinctorium]RWS14154.1 vigilin-like protein [Dinothrombium tinctorium]RWS15554.1 vigilin-like protein [Dinothrombium tinctorium]
MNPETISQTLNAEHHQSDLTVPLTMPVGSTIDPNGAHLYTGPGATDASAMLHDSSYVHKQADRDYHVDNEIVAPSYDEIFPALPETDNSQSKVKDVEIKAEPWSQKMKVKSSNVSQIFRISPHERRFRETHAQFGDNTTKTCVDIMKQTSTHIETSSSRDGTISFLITGKEENVLQAKRMIASEFKAQDCALLSIPKQHHKFILGKNYKKIQELEQQTGTKIHVPKQSDMSEEIRIVGPKDAVEKAVHEIQLVANDAASRASERITIPKVYHPFILGPFNENLNQLMEETKAKIHIPPPSVISDEISITGETEAVAMAKQRIQEIYEEKQKKCQTVCMEVKKSQHRYIIGKGRQTLQEFFKQTGVSVEMPPIESASETITLRGEQDKLGPALKLCYEKATSEIEVSMKVEAWVQKRLSGPKKLKLQEYKQSYPNAHMLFLAEENLIKIKGSRSEVEKLQEIFEKDIAKIKSEIKIKEIRVHPKFHCHIIGKSGATINQIREDTGAEIHVPSEGGHGLPFSDMIRIEGSPQAIEKAASQLKEIIKNLEEKEKEINKSCTKELIIDHRFHKQLIGTKGEKIKEIRDRFNQVIISFPDPSEKSDKVTIRGPKENVENCYRYLAQQNKELLASNYSIQVPINKEFHKCIIGKEGANIRKIRDETETKIELPSESNDSDVIVITGRKENVEQARDKILAIQNSFLNTVKMDIIIPAKFHNSIIGAQGRIIQSIREECGDVLIKFPPQGSKSDKVSIRGPKDNVIKAKQLLIELSNEKQLNSYTEEIKCRRDFHRYLIGKNGGKIKKIRESSGAKIIFPTDKELEESSNKIDVIYIIGKKECVLKAKEELEAEISLLENTVTETYAIPRKFHSMFIVRQLGVLRQIQQETGTYISFPDRENDRANENVTIKACSREKVEEAKARIKEIVDDLTEMEVVIDRQYHKALLVVKGQKITNLQQEYDVQIKFPERGVNFGNGDEPEYVNGNNHIGDSDSEHSEGRSPLPHKSDIITIIGRKKNCETAKEALLALVPIEIEVTVPFDYHRFIIGQKGKDVKELMNKYEVQINVPPSNEESDIIKIQGAKDNVERAKAAILQRVQELDEAKQDRIARNYKVEIRVDPKYHPKIIGKKGSVISGIRSKYEVQIHFPERTDDQNQTNSDLITITGYEDKVNKARDDIMEIVKNLEEQISETIEIDYRIHPRLIGARGRNIRKIMDKYKVDIRFPRQDDANKNSVTIIGLAEGVEEAKDRLLELEDEYLQDVADEPPSSRYQNSNSEKIAGDESRGFLVKGGPWEQKQQIVPDTNNTEEFPSMGSEAPSEAPKPWGPRGVAFTPNYPNN